MSSELKLSLENFQSISSGELVFKTGLNFIIGQSNSGKSATFRALKACLTNPIGSQRFIKRGSNKAQVALSYLGNEIIWERTSKESKYTINGEQYIKTGRSNAFKISDDSLGFALDESENIMNIEEELQLPFPFDLPKTELFKLFENVFCVSDSSVIAKSAKEHENSVKQDISNLSLELSKNEAKFKELVEFKENVNIEILESYRKSLIGRKNRLEVLSKDLPIVKRTKKLVDSQIEIKDYSLEDKLDEYKALKDCKLSAQKAKDLHSLSKKLGNIDIEIRDSAKNKYEDLLDIRKATNKLERIKGFGAPINTFENKLERYKELVQVQKEALKLSKIEHFEIVDRTFISLLDKYNSLVVFKKYVEEVKENLKAGKKELTETEERIKSLDNKLREYKVCPLCHQELKGE